MHTKRKEDRATESSIGCAKRRAKPVWITAGVQRTEEPWRDRRERQRSGVNGTEAAELEIQEVQEKGYDLVSDHPEC